MKWAPQQQNPNGKSISNEPKNELGLSKGYMKKAVTKGNTEPQMEKVATIMTLVVVGEVM